MFYKCFSLKEIVLSLFKTDNVINMNSMFILCSSLEEINLSSFNSKKFTDMNEMFSGFSELKKLIYQILKLILKLI